MLRAAGAAGLVQRLSRRTLDSGVLVPARLTANAHCGSVSLASPKQRLLPLLDNAEQSGRLLEMAEKDPALAELLLPKAADGESEGELKEEKVVPDLTQRQLRLVALNNFIPFVGFGFFDNLIMIVAGEAMDTTLCVHLGYTTMVAAALGNTLSDVVGISLGTAIEAFAEKMGLPPSEATVEQQKTMPYKLANNVGSVVGIVIGCILGMFPLWFVDGQGEELRQLKKRNEEMYDMVEQQLSKAVGSDRASFFVADMDKRVLTMKRSHDAAGHVEVPIDGPSYVAECWATGNAVNAHHLPPEASKFGYLMENMLCVPIKSANQVIGVVQMLNKQKGDHFTSHDEQTSKRFAVMLGYLLQKNEGVHTVAQMIEDERLQEHKDKLHSLAADIFDQVIKRLGGMTGADRTSFFLVDEDKDTLYTLIAEGERSLTVQTGQGMVGHVAQTGKVLNIADAYDCPFFNKAHDIATGYRTKSAIMIPVLGSDGRVIGVLQALNKHGDEPFTEVDERVFTLFAEHISVAIESKSESFEKFADAFKVAISRYIEVSSFPSELF